MGNGIIYLLFGLATFGIIVGVTNLVATVIWFKKDLEMEYMEEDENEETEEAD